MTQLINYHPLRDDKVKKREPNKGSFKKGHKLSKESIEKMKNSLKGRKIDPEVVKKVALANRGIRRNWKGGTVELNGGYRGIYSINHPYKNKKNYVAEHRLVMEKHIGRTLLPTEVVHHINGDKKDNRIENLMLFSSTGEHSHHHRKLEKDKRENEN